ncbi:MAG: hypothetical protein M1816_006801 [Peltula sp. TS41687]|nr:MAG: hypothetical protein M1816_006801 [Peltula sp. TS41687]
MAFSYGNTGDASFAGNMSPQISGVQVHTGPDLEEIRTEALGFLAFAGEQKLRLLPTPWPAEALPPPTSSLLTVASKRGLVAAAGPDGVVLASTDALRAAFAGPTSGESNIIPFDPQMKLPIPMRISQVAFSADENYLVISAEQGGGLAVYDEQALQQGGVKPAFELSTQGVPLRALLPNPTSERAELFAVVAANGDLMIANMTTRQFISGPHGPVLRQQVSCVSWSTKGKQLVVGLGNGACHQLTPEGEGKADIPRPPQITNDQHVSSISWLENNVFLVVHTPTSFDSDSVPVSTYHVVTREPDSSSFVFQRLPEPCSPFGLNRSPPHHFILRLKDFPPSLQDVLVIGSTGSTDVGLATRSLTPLTQETLADKIVNVFTTTAIADDSRRAQLPMTGDMSDTSPIGMALDLSSKDTVTRPIPAEEIDRSPTPLPALLILNNEGLLLVWWIVYSDSVRQGTAYPGLVAVAGDKQQALSQPVSSSPSTNQASPGAFGSLQAPSNVSRAAPAFGSPGLGAPSGPQPAASSAFGSTSTLGAKPSPWGTQASPVSVQPGRTWGQPTFGSTTPLGANNQGSTFGSTSALGAQRSPWSSSPSATTSSTGVAFGKPSEPGPQAGFSGAGSTSTLLAPSSGGFGSYANQGGFDKLAAAGAGQNVLSQTTGDSPFASAGENMDTGLAFGAPDTNPVKGSPLGLGASGFTLSSGFKPDGTAKDDLPKPTSQRGNGLFGSAFGSALETTQTVSKSPTIPEADMESSSRQPARVEKASTTPTATPTSSAPKAGVSAQTAAGGAVGILSPVDIPAAVQHSEPAALSSGNDSKSKQSAESTPAPAASASKILVVEEAPLPPDPYSKKAFPSSSSDDDKGVEEISLPGKESDEGDDWEDSGEDVAHDRSPTMDPSRSIGITPRSSSGESYEKSPVGETFTKISRPVETQKSRPLFGEIAGNSFPVLPAPSRVQQSTSPVRSALPKNLVRPESARSLTSPGGVTKSLRLHAVPPRPNRLRQEIDRESPPAEEKSGKQQPSVTSPTLDLEELDSGDDDDEAVRAELAAEVQGSTTLGPLVVHQDYVGNIKKTGIAGQIERLYRDINSMIDTLGLNAKSLKSFVKGHSEHYKEEGRDVEDLETDDEWCLIEVPELSHLEGKIMDELQKGKVHDVQAKIESCRDLHRDALKLRSKQNELRKAISARTDPTQIAATRSAPLSSEQTIRQHDIRSELANVQKLITEAEEGVSVLRARIASIQTDAGKAGSPSVPTVEAVMNTIMKMTTMAEKRSGDVDVLETKLRKLKIDAGNGDFLKATAPFSTPSAVRSHGPKTPGSSTYGLFYTPESSGSTPRAMNSSLGASTSSYIGTPSSNMGMTNTRDLAALRTKAAGKREVKARLRNALEKVGPRLKNIDD